MGNDINKMFEDLIGGIKSFNNDPKIIDQRVKSIVVTKLEEAQLWFGKMVVKTE